MAVVWLLLGLVLGAVGAWVARGRESAALLAGLRARDAAGERQASFAELVAPVRDTLARLDGRLLELERARVDAYASLREQVRALADGQGQLRGETANLVKALRAPAVRGRWGELQLRRVVELAGMQERCDFVEQASVTLDGARLRPDLVVKLPGGKQVAVDAKAPLSAYLEALEARTDEVRRARLADHARQIRDHIAALSRKAYWEALRPAPEFVVLFLPGEAFFSAALEQDPGLIEAGAAVNVVLATPTTLIALLRAVAYGWREEAVAENARAVSDLGRELHERLASVGGHVARVGQRLAGAVEAYNQAVGALESRVLVSARRFQDLGAAKLGVELRELEPVLAAPREPQSPELTAAGELVAPAERAHG
jgi:DNA recombination protein RmuC